VTLRSAQSLRSGGLRPFSLRLTNPLATAHGEIARRAGWMIRLEDADGFTGLGEATPLPEFGTETSSHCERVLRDSMKEWLGLRTGFEKSVADPVIERHCAAAPCARAALDCAVADLEAQRRSIALGAYWRNRAGFAGPPASSVLVQALVGGGTSEAVAASAKQSVDSGFRAFKLKLAVSAASRDLSQDLDRISALREVVGSDARLRLDANEAWTRDEAFRALTALADFDVDYVEQPIARDDLEGLAFLDREAPTRVAADEALLGDGLVQCLASESARILIVKPAAIGGIGTAIDLVARANESGLRLIWSSLLDGAVGRQAALHLAAAFGPADEIHGLGTGPLLDQDFAGGAMVANGAISLPSSPGLGMSERLRSRDEFGESGPLWTGTVEFLEATR